jgi:AcrR family transcriptional regulator
MTRCRVPTDVSNVKIVGHNVDMNQKPGYHHGDLRQALLTAADDVLRERGLQGFTLRECARRAGVSHAAPKHHFGDVRGMLTEVAAHGFVRLTHALRKKLTGAGDDLDAQFAATADAYAGFAQAYPEHFRIMFRADLIDVASVRLRDAAVETLTELTNVIRRQRGETDITSAELDASVESDQLLGDILIGWCHVHGYAHLRLEGQLSMVPKARLRRLARTASDRLAGLIRSNATR